MFKKRRQPPVPDEPESPAHGGGTFLDGVFGDRRDQPSRPPDEQSSSRPDPELPVQLPVQRPVERARDGQPGARPRQQTPGPVAAPAPSQPARSQPARTPEPARTTAVAPAPAATRALSPQPPVEPTVTAAEPVQRSGAPGADRVRPGRRLWADRGRSRGGDLLLVLLTCVVIALAVAVLTGNLGPLRHPSTTSPSAGGTSRLTPPPALPAPGSFQRTTIGRKGTVRVTQWIRSGTALRSIKLTPVSGSPSATARATGLVVATDRSEVRTVPIVGPKGGRIVFSQPAKLVYLRYHLSGVLDRATSVPGRVLVRATSMRLAYRPRTGPAVVRVQAPTITSMACTDLPLRGGAAQQASLPYACGTPTRSGWTTVLKKKHRDASVSAQVELR
jgi:hypothetical protein